MTRNSEALQSFVDYCAHHPDERFWQALRNWSGQSFILASDREPTATHLRDTFGWEGRAPGADVLYPDDEVTPVRVAVDVELPDE